MIPAILFYLVSAVAVVSAVLVVTVKNVFHAALWLILSLTAVGGVYALLAADFLFAVQILVYVGGVMVLLLFVVLLSGKPSDWAARQVSGRAWLAAIFAVLVAAAVIGVLAVWPLAGAAPANPPTTTAALGRLLLNELLLPFELISLVLVAAMIGAIHFSARKSP